uniref:Uncharacterized protein n=1 Tax=viral metagenome TaxID=1070528 RepID=A0A6C0JI01_9ZZZZ
MSQGYPLFHAASRGGIDDRYSNAEASKRNMSATYYANMPASCGNGSAWSAAAEYVGLVPRGNFGNSPEGGCGIDTQTDLLFGDPAAVRMKGPKQLFQRPFPTTPFLGMGTIDGIPDQNRVIFGHSTANRKSIQTVTDKQFPVFEPLIQEKEDEMVRDNYFVEPFLRGGFASRNVAKVRLDLKS